MSLQSLNSKESKMIMPGFTAELSLQGSQSYAGESHQRARAGGEGVVVPSYCHRECFETSWGYNCYWVGCTRPGVP